MSVTLVSCLKDEGYEDRLYGSVRDTEGGKYVSIRTAGVQNFQKSSVLIDTKSAELDTVEIFIDLDFAEKTTAPVTVKLAIDNAKVAAYNSANNTNFLTTTANMAFLKATEVTIPAGERTVRTELYIRQNTFDPSKSYMIPVTITDASGYSLSSNLNIRYFNIIGNVFAGSYKWDFTRWNNQTGTGTPSSLSFTGKDVTILPVTETVFTVTSGYFIQPRYIVSFTNNNGVYSNFKVEFNADDVKVMSDNGVTVVEGPNIIKADPINKEFIFQFIVQTGPTSFRYLLDRYYK